MVCFSLPNTFLYSTQPDMTFTDDWALTLSDQSVWRCDGQLSLITMLVLLTLVCFFRKLVSHSRPRQNGGHNSSCRHVNVPYLHHGWCKMCLTLLCPHKIRANQVNNCEPVQLFTLLPGMSTFALKVSWRQENKYHSAMLHTLSTGTNSG